MFTASHGDQLWIQLHEALMCFSGPASQDPIGLQTASQEKSFFKIFFSLSEKPKAQSTGLHSATLTSIPVLQGQAHFNNLDTQLIIEVSHA